MTDVVPHPSEGVEGEVLSGEVVRALFDRNEESLSALQEELAAAAQEADAAEARVRAHPGVGLLSADEVGDLLPPAPEASAAGPPSADAARTTVVHRPRPASTSGEQVPGGAGDPPEVDERGRMTRLVTGHWVWKAGIALMVVALLLLKFG